MHSILKIEGEYITTQNAFVYVCFLCFPKGKTPSLNHDLSLRDKLWITVFVATLFVCATTWTILRSHSALSGSR